MSEIDVMRLRRFLTSTRDTALANNRLETDLYEKGRNSGIARTCNSVLRELDTLTGPEESVSQVLARKQAEANAFRRRMAEMEDGA